MKFKANTRRKAIEYEKALLEYWKTHKTFEKSVESRPADNAFVFYDGPPFITGSPHHGTLLSSIVKDAVPRYQTMKGKRVERVWGWDCHGLPAENFVEKKLGISSRQEIGTKISLEDYITACRENMVETGDLWEDTIDRIGRWVDFKGAYKTMGKDYMESVWWAFKQLYEKGKIYEGEKVLMYDTQWATPLSKAEVTMDVGAYLEVTDPSVYVKFGLLSDDVMKAPEKYLLAWTTTPWTLPGNTAIGVNKNIEYADVEINGEVMIVAEELVEKVFVDEKHRPLDYKILRTYKGNELVGKKYLELDISKYACIDYYNGNEYKIWATDYVTTESGTGIVHLAPAYGEEDFELAQVNKIPIVHILDDYGKYNTGEWQGEDVWEINKTIAKTLLERGDVWKIDYIRHEYPHNPRTGHRLMYRAHPSWFMDIDGQRTEMLEQNSKHINWFPEHIKHGRFEKTVQTAPEWNLSRDRFWATAMPVWKGTDKKGKQHIRVVGSYAELKKLSGKELDDYHRPWIDDVTFTIDGVKYQRIEKVLDCWFESGSMPFAQFHYPFENIEKFEQNFPGDFIVEYVGQVRAWFYYMHAVSVGLFGHNAFTNVITTGTLAGNDGRKMSKSYGNYTDPNELMNQYNVDSLRFLLLSSPVLNGEDFALHDKSVGDVARKLSMIWNMYDFFTMYASVDGWQFDGDLTFPGLNPGKNTGKMDNVLDQWIVSRVHQLIQEVEKHMDGYDIPNAMKPILPFIDDASNWYVRRSRKRFWKSSNDADKNNAYQTLHYVLVMLAQVMAPFTPFLAEELYQKLTGKESVHLLDWPEARHINELGLKNMKYVRDVINEGLSYRAKRGVKIRQPLARAKVVDWDSVLDKTLVEIIQDELNVKLVEISKDSFAYTKQYDEEFQKIDNFEPNILIDFSLTDDLRQEGIIREVVRAVQNARKKAGLNVDDRIQLSLKTDGELSKAIKEYETIIMNETLAKTITQQEYSYSEKVKIDEHTLTLSLERIE